MIDIGNNGAPGVSRPSSGSRRILPLTLVLGVGLMLGACSTMADMGEATTNGISTAAHAMNPFNWFGGSDADDAAKQAEQDRAGAETQAKTAAPSVPGEQIAQGATGANEERYPKLSSVPDRPRAATSKRANQGRAELRQGLIADTANAQYTDNELRAQTTSNTGSRQVDSARSNERIAGAPPAQPAPTMAVTTVPVAAVPTPSAPPQASARASAAPQVVPSPVARATTTPGGGYGARQAAAASAAPVTAISPGAPPLPSSGPVPTPTPRAPQKQAAAALTAPQPAATEVRSVLKTIQVATIYFNDGSARLSSNDKQVVDQVAIAVRRTGGMLRIIGHSSMGAAGGDAKRAEMINYKVSLERANSVASELLRTGIPGNQMQVLAEGARNPIYAENSPTGAAGNRRTEIYLDFYERL